MIYSRRDVNLLLPALAAAFSTQAAERNVLPSACYPFDTLPVKTNPKNGNQSRNVFDGETHQGYHIDLHITTLQPGEMPHPPHRHEHEEMMLIKEGSLEFTISGKSTHIGPGSVAYVKSNDEHGLKNVGDKPAQYFVLAIGKDSQT